MKLLMYSTVKIHNLRTTTDPIDLTIFLETLFTSKSLRKRMNGGAGKMLSVKPEKFRFRKEMGKN